jgi:hypothetical protein
MRTITDPMKAPCGTSFMEICQNCGESTGVVAFKKTGPDPHKVNYTGPTQIINPERPNCEFCTFLAAFFEAGHKVAGRRYGAAKIIDEQGHLVAFVPFHDGDDRNNRLSDGTQYRMNHRTVVRARPSPEKGKMELFELVDPGVPDEAS